MTTMYTLSFDEIDPYIRLCHLLKVSRAEPVPLRAAYDHRIMYICQGSGTLYVNGQTYSAEPGTLFYWQAGIAYEIVPADNVVLHICGINFDFTQAGKHYNYPVPPDHLDVFSADRLIETVEMQDAPCFNEVICLRDMHAAEQRLLEMEREFMTKKRYYMQQVRGPFLMLLSDIARHATDTYTDQADRTHQVDRILQYIREHYHQPLSNLEIAAHFNFHPVYINRLLVKYTGSSLHQYLITYRLAQAINLLQIPGKTVAEAADETGFTDTHHFSRAFKKRYGLSPKSYITAAGRVQK